MWGLTILVSLLAITSGALAAFSVTFEWNYIDFTWPSEATRTAAMERRDYIPGNNPLAGIKIWKDKMYLTIPRWKIGVPATLTVTSATPVGNNTAPNLEPFPSWEMQTIGDCNAFQFVQSMEIDPLGRMWVIDVGKTPTASSNPSEICQPRLVILDLENNGAVLHTYYFPEEVAQKHNNYMNDIVLDHEDGGFAYITDTSSTDPGLIVYSLQNNTSWKIRHESMNAHSDAIDFLVGGTRYNSSVNIDSIALSPASKIGEQRQVYYTPLSAFQLYSLPVSIVKSRNITSVDDYVKDLGRKTSQTDGMAMSNMGILFFGLLADDAIARWDTNVAASVSTGQTVFSRDHAYLQWPDTFSFDQDGNLWCVSNALQNFFASTINISQPNYRVVKAEMNMKSYQYFANGTVPTLPQINGGVNLSAFGTTISLASLLLHFAR